MSNCIRFLPSRQSGFNWIKKDIAIKMLLKQCLKSLSTCPFTGN